MYNDYCITIIIYTYSQSPGDSHFPCAGWHPVLHTAVNKYLKKNVIIIIKLTLNSESFINNMSAARK
jgi:hypothetical protein